jgi:prevent-host-death family protein
MEIISATHMKNHLSEVFEIAKREPIKIQRNSKDVAVIMSSQDYERITQINRSLLKKAVNNIQMSAQEQGMTEEVLAEIMSNE